MFHLVIFSCWFLATIADSKSMPKPTEGRIVGGRDTDITDVPYQVSVRRERVHKCGGCIIGPKHVLTAAHCVEEKDPKLFSVRAGSSYYFKDGQKVDVARIISHPNYDLDTVDYDVAVLILKDTFKSNEGVKIAHLADIEPKEGDMILISGWGYVEKNGRPSETLRSVSVPVISRDLCIKKYDGDENITDRMFCAVHPKGGKDACEGDSGGPAMINGKLAGIVSWGDGCGDKNSPGVYANIAKIQPWISLQIL